MIMGKIFVAVLLALCAHLSLFPPPAAAAGEVVPFGFCPKYNPRIMFQLYQPFIDYLNEKTPYRFEIKLTRVYRETIESLGRKEIMIASCGPVSYIRARERYPVRPLLRALNRDGTPHYRGIIVVRSDSAVRKLGDLKGRSFAFGQTWSTAGHVLPEYYLAKAGIRLDDLKRYDFLRHHDTVVGAVLKGEFDAGAVKDVVAHQNRDRGLRFIHVSDPIPTVPIIVRNDAPRDLVESVRTALLKIDPRDQAYQKRLALWDEEFRYGFTGAKDSDYDVIRKILPLVSIDRAMKGQNRN